MKHDRLLAIVDSVFYEDEGGMQLDLAGFNNQYRAIRSIVELHKPYDNSNDLDGSDLRCSECGQGFEHYPCPTIQRIEKELCNV